MPEQFIKVSNHPQIASGFTLNAMVHTAFCSPDESEEIYNNMKKELGAFMSKNTSWEEECEFYDEFVMKY